MGKGVRHTISLALLSFVLISACTTNDAGYFPPTELSDDGGYFNRVFSRHLLTMNEPVLHRQVNVNYSVRLTRLTDDVDAFSLRIDRLANGEIFSSYKRFNYVRAGEINPRATAVIAHKLTSGDFARLAAEIGRQDFFSMPEQTEFIEGNIVWLLEVFDGTNFHAVVRPVAPRGQPFGSIAAIAGEVAQAGNLTGS